MIGYYKLEENVLNSLKIPIKNIEENIYDLCCPLLVMNSSSLNEEVRILYETLGIPILSYLELEQYDPKQYQELEKYVHLFSSYLKINISIELSEEEQLGHLLRVGKYAHELATHLNLPKEEVKDIYIAALFHDVGKAKIPKEIIGKKGKLTEEE